MVEEENKIFIDKKLDNSIRSYKEFDNIIYTVGINNLILGLIKIRTISSEKEEANKNIDEFYINKINDIIPIGSYINGCLAIYNENTFEDFESVLNEEIEKIKKINKNLLIDESEEEIKYIQIAMKELLYLDDEDDFNYEFKKYGDKTDDDFEIFFENDLIQKYFNNNSKNKFFVSRTEILFNNQKLDENKNIIEIKKEQLKDQEILNNIFDDKNMIIDENDYNEITIEKNNEFNKNINNLYYTNVKLAFKKSNDEKQLLENLRIIDLEIKEDLKTNIYIEIIGIISSESKNKRKFYEKMLNKIKNSVQNLFSENNKNINQKVILFNNLYNSFPYNLVSSIPIDIIDNKYISIKLDKKIRISDELNLSKIFNINGAPFYDFLPIININTENFSEHVLNPHLNIPNILEKPKENNIIRALVRGDYYYYHYNQDNFIDSGWGCAYRSLQTLISWFILNTSVGKNLKVPTIPEIQTILFKLGDKDKKIIGSNDWIGAFEVNLVLNELSGIDNQILYVSSGTELNSKGRELLYHFQHNGTPVMVGGGIYAYTILGVDYDKVKGSCKFLILDPHYIGQDDSKIIINKGWCNWKTIDIFKKENFYNLCLPLADFTS